jgi:hypothetical protein
VDRWRRLPAANGFGYDKAVTQPNIGIYNCDPKNVVALKNTFQPP